MHKLKYLIIPFLVVFFITSCEKNDNTVIDPSLSFPYILSNFITPVVLNSDTVSCFAGATVQSDEPVAFVLVRFYDLRDNILVTSQLRDNGVFPDTTAGDGKYTGVINYVFPCREVGRHRVEFLAVNQSGLNSPPIYTDIQIIQNPNNSPVVNNIIIVPDSTQVGQNSFFIFMISATDPDGQCDIARVFYTGFRPDGSSLTPLDLYDDGSCCIIGGTGVTSGDSVANDSKFTRKTFGAPSQTGYYRYFIRAVDRTGDTSNVLVDSIYVYP